MSAAELAAAAGSDPEAVVAGWRRLHDQHALVLNPATDEIRMANPFSAVPTAYRVWAAGRWWYANCAWDAFGICAALHADGHIESSCPDCGEPLSIAVREQRPDDADLLAHAWWGDRLSPSWRPRPREQNQAILHRLELRSGFWRLA